MKYHVKTTMTKNQYNFVNGDTNYILDSLLQKLIKEIKINKQSFNIIMNKDDNSYSFSLDVNIE